MNSNVGDIFTLLCCSILGAYLTYLALGTAASATTARTATAQMIMRTRRPTPMLIPGTRAIHSALPPLQLGMVLGRSGMVKVVKIM